MLALQVRNRYSTNTTITIAAEQSGQLHGEHGMQREVFEKAGEQLGKALSALMLRMASASTKSSSQTFVKVEDFIDNGRGVLSLPQYDHTKERLGVDVYENRRQRSLRWFRDEVRRGNVLTEQMVTRQVIYDALSNAVYHLLGRLDLPDDKWDDLKTAATRIAMEDHSSAESMKAIIESTAQELVASLQQATATSNVDAQDKETQPHEDKTNEFTKLTGKRLETVAIRWSKNIRRSKIPLPEGATYDSVGRVIAEYLNCEPNKRDLPTVSQDAVVAAFSAAGLSAESANIVYDKIIGTDDTEENT